MFDAAVTPVKIISNAVDEDFQTGRTKAPVFTLEDPQSVNILLDSKNRLDKTTNPFDFVSSINSNLFRSRFFRVRKVVIPKPPNVTIHNNSLTITWGPGNTVTTVLIPVGFYNTLTIANTIQSLISTATATPGWTCIFYPSTRTFTLKAPGAILFFFNADSSFIRYGESFMAFTGVPVGGTTAINGQNGWSGGVASMLYTRYIIVCSISLNNYSIADSRTNDRFINEDIIAITDLTDIYSEGDWAVGTPFAGGYSTVLTAEAPNVSLRNPQRNLAPEIDLYVLDEYGFSFNDCFDLGPPLPPDNIPYPANQDGIAVWMEVTF